MMPRWNSSNAHAERRSRRRRVEAEIVADVVEANHRLDAVDAEVRTELAERHVLGPVALVVLVRASPCADRSAAGSSPDSGSSPPCPGGTDRCAPHRAPRSTSSPGCSWCPSRRAGGSACRGTACRCVDSAFFTTDVASSFCAMTRLYGLYGCAVGNSCVCAMRDDAP